MLQSEQIENLISWVAALDRTALVQLIGEHRGTFPLDFTPHFLNSVDLDRLRHIFVAICLRCQKAPGEAASAAA